MKERARRERKARSTDYLALYQKFIEKTPPPRRIYLNPYMEGATPEELDFVDEIRNPFRQDMYVGDRVGVIQEMYRILFFAENHPNVAPPLNDFIYDLRYQILPLVWHDRLKSRNINQMVRRYDEDIWEHLVRFDRQWKQFQRRVSRPGHVAPDLRRDFLNDWEPDEDDWGTE
jgi:hypothetical protein